MNRNRWICGVAAAAALFLSLSAPASASYTDLPETHWAYAQMDRARSLGVVNGVGGSQMAPQLPLTWSQFLAMASRAFAPEQYRAASEALPWDLAGYQAAQDAGLLDGSPAVTEDTLSDPISRQDTAALLSRAIPETAQPRNDPYGLEPVRRDARTALSDYSEIDAAHQGAVDRLYELGIIKGKSDGSFGPGDTLRRADGTVLLMRVLEIVDRAHYGDKMSLTFRFVDPSGVEVASADNVDGYVGGYLSWLISDYLPENHALVGYDGGGTVSSVCSVYTVTVRPLSRLEIEKQDATERYYSGEMTLEEYIMQDFWLRETDENYRKHVLLFGNPEQRRFSSRAEAEQHMTTVTVPVWTIKKSGKTASTASVQVHAALADEVTAIFTEIFNDPEQFPILNLGGYSWRGDSAAGEHNCGTAIDINSDQNYSVRDGRPQSGMLWAPGDNPYSIPADGSVVRIFAEHGWSWGGNAWADGTDPGRGYHDYMHFSYMGG